VSAHVVRQRLRLGTVSPVIMAAYREGKLTLDHVMAFTVTENRDAQERAFTDLPNWQCTPPRHPARADPGGHPGP